MLILENSIVIILSLLIVLTIFHQIRTRHQRRIRETQMRIINKLKENQGDVFQAVYDFHNILESDNYISKNEYPVWCEKWRYLKPLLTEWEKLGEINGKKI